MTSTSVPLPTITTDATQAFESRDAPKAGAGQASHAPSSSMIIPCAEIAECFSTHRREDKEVVVDLINPLILIHEEKIFRSESIHLILEDLSQPNRPFVFIGGGVGGDAMEMLATNNPARGSTLLAGVEVMSIGADRRSLLRKLGRLTDGTVVEGDLINKSSLSISRLLGGAKRILIEENKDDSFLSTTYIFITGGKSPDLFETGPSNKCPLLRKKTLRPPGTNYR